MISQPLQNVPSNFTQPCFVCLEDVDTIGDILKIKPYCENKHLSSFRDCFLHDTETVNSNVEPEDLANQIADKVAKV